MADETLFWTIAAAIGQLASAAAAIAGLIFLALQIRAARRVADVAALQAFTKETMRQEAQLANAESPEKKNHAFTEYLNFLEVYASAINGKILPPISRKMVEDSLSNSLASIQATDPWSQKFLEAIRTPSTFEEIGIFLKRHKKQIQEKADLFLNPSK